MRCRRFSGLSPRNYKERHDADDANNYGRGKDGEGSERDAFPGRPDLRAFHNASALCT
jgi:hypothetical protein